MYAHHHLAGPYVYWHFNLPQTAPCHPNCQPPGRAPTKDVGILEDESVRLRKHLMSPYVAIDPDVWSKWLLLLRTCSSLCVWGLGARRRGIVHISGVLCHPIRIVHQSSKTRPSIFPLIVQHIGTTSNPSNVPVHVGVRLGAR